MVTSFYSQMTMSDANLSAYKSEFLAFKSTAHIFDETRLIFDRLARNLSDKPTFFHEVDDTLSSLDILVYAYLKYLLVNTSESKEVTLLRQS